jgi:hypothetical protein
MPLPVVSVSRNRLLTQDLYEKSPRRSGNNDGGPAKTGAEAKRSLCAVNEHLTGLAFQPVCNAASPSTGTFLTEPNNEKKHE